MRVVPQLMFEGQAQEALDLYEEAFSDFEITLMERYGAERPGPEGMIYQAELNLMGQKLRFIDSPLPHDFSFTPSISLFVDCTNREELERLAELLAAEGQVLMPMADYGFSQAFTFISDRFGVSWQLNLPYES